MSPLSPQDIDLLLSRDLLFCTLCVGPLVMISHKLCFTIYASFSVRHIELGPWRETVSYSCGQEFCRPYSPAAARFKNNQRRHYPLSHTHNFLWKLARSTDFLAPWVAIPNIWTVWSIHYRKGLGQNPVLVSCQLGFEEEKLVSEKTLPLAFGQI
jgi:hypothetical protein